MYTIVSRGIRGSPRAICRNSKILNFGPYIWLALSRMFWDFGVVCFGIWVWYVLGFGCRMFWGLGVVCFGILAPIDPCPGQVGGPQQAPPHHLEQGVRR